MRVLRQYWNYAQPTLQSWMEWGMERGDRLSDSSIFAIAVVLALILRGQCLSFESEDYRIYLLVWYDFIQSHGGVQALKETFANYSPPYLYWLVFAATALAGVPKVIAIKLLAVIFDFVCAGFVYGIVRLQYPTGKRAIAAFCTILFLPTVFLNSSLWGQCDSIYTTGVVACLYFLLRQRLVFAFLSLGLGFAFKQQALFFVPLLLILWAKGQVKGWMFLMLPATYLVAVLPAWGVGRSLPDLLQIYTGQIEGYRHLTKNAPNLYQWISNRHYDVMVPLGIVLTVIVLLGLGWRVWRSRTDLTPDRLLQLALTIVFLVPFLLPKMHERYFFMADVLSVVVAFYRPKFFWMPILIQLSSLLTYTDFLLGERWVSFKVLSLVLAVFLGFLVKVHFHTFAAGDGVPVKSRT
jgi:Gpi18-like mannosyltransferase